MNNKQSLKLPDNAPTDVVNLATFYGAPSQAGFGSAVFYQQQLANDDLTQLALANYKYFVGALWERYGADAWLGPWKEVYARKPGTKPNIIVELRGITDPDARLSVPMILDNVDDAEKARLALSVVYDDPAVTELRVFNLGDGEALAGLLVAGHQKNSGASTFLVFLLD